MESGMERSRECAVQELRQSGGATRGVTAKKMQI